MTPITKTVLLCTTAYGAGIASFIYAAHLWLDKHLLTKRL